MTRAELQALAERYVAALRTRDPSAVAALHAEDAIVDSPMFSVLHGRSAIEESYRQLHTIFPDLDQELVSLVVDPPQFVMTTRNTATQEGEFFGLPASHKRLQFMLVRMTTVDNGLIKHERRIYDFTGMLVQMGVLRAKPAKPG